MSQNDTGKILSSKQKMAIEALLSTATIDDAAKTADISRSSITRWLREEHFQNALRDAEKGALKQISRNLIGLANKATNALEDGLGEDQKINARLRAAEIVIDRLIKLREILDFEERLIKLEERINGK